MNYQHAFVTGACSGLGWAIVQELLLLGIDVTLSGRSGEKLDKALALLDPPLRERAWGLCCDLSERNEVSGLIARAREQHPSQKDVDLLINNAGVLMTGKTESISADGWQESFQVNCLSPISLIRQALPAMKTLNRGMIVNITSGVAYRSLPFHGAYCSSKAALRSMSESLGVELLDSPVHVLQFSPGPLRTEFVSRKKHFGDDVIVESPAQGMEPQVVAQKLLSAMRKKKKRTVLGRRAKLARLVDFFSPSTVDRLLFKSIQVRPKA